MAEILVDPGDLTEKGNSLKTIASNIQTNLNEIQKEIEGMKSFYTGQAAEASVAKFNELKPKLEKCYQNIEEYSKFLINAAKNYEEVEIANIQE